MIPLISLNLPNNAPTFAVQTPSALVIAAVTGFNPTAIIAGKDSTEAPPANPLRKPTANPTMKIATISTMSDVKNSLIYSRNEEENRTRTHDCFIFFK